jgi:hypothetical protein
MVFLRFYTKKKKPLAQRQTLWGREEVSRGTTPVLPFCRALRFMRVRVPAWVRAVRMHKYAKFL